MDSSWAKPLPERHQESISPGHAHPMPRWVKVALVAWSVLFGAAVCGMGVFYFDQRAHDARVVEQTRVQVLAELDRRSAARDATERAQMIETIRVVCEVLAGDLRPSDRTQRLAKQLKCPDLPPP